MLIIPSLDIKNGKVVEKINYDKQFDFYYNELSEHPLELCKLLRSENAKTLHINDIDGTIESPNFIIIQEILNNLDIPITLSSKSGKLEECKLYLENPFLRVALCQFVIENHKIVKELIQEYSSSRIIFYALAKDEDLILWGNESGMRLEEYFKILKEVGATRLIYGNIDWNFENATPNYDIPAKISQETNLKITLYDGVNNYQQLNKVAKLEPFGIDSIIISKPLYKNNFPCQEIWRLAETF